VPFREAVNLSARHHEPATSNQQQTPRDARNSYNARVPVALIIPALDEEHAIGALLDAVDPTLVRDVIVGDNGSRDATAEVARSHGAQVVRVEERGYGAACAGALAALADDVDVVLFMDADGSDDPAEIPLVLDGVLSGRADLVIGSRALGIVEPGALTPQQRFGNWLATRMIALLYGHRYTDLGPFRAIRRDLLDRIGMRDRRYGWTVEMQVRALQLGARVAEVPVRYRRRVGKSKISGTVTGVLKAGWWIVYTILKYSRG
jgi:glycosyltransferase involved in cell wall biosynthesis